jgi:uncharacterized protein (TIGR03435 family)
MITFRKTGVACVLAVVTLSLHASTALAQSSNRGPTFEVVSIKPNTATFAPGVRSNVVTWRPDGGLTMTNVALPVIISRAYPGTGPGDIADLPDWARNARFDVSATSSLSQVTADDRAAMLRAMLVDRFKLALHVEKREQQAYVLQLARADGRLGPGLKPTETDCARIMAERAATAEATLGGSTPPPPGPPDFSVPPALCTLRTIDERTRNFRGDKQGHLGSLLEGEATMDVLASMLRFTTGRLVVNKTALPGAYQMTMNFDGTSGRGGPPLAQTDVAAPSVFTAVQEQLGLKLESARVEVDTFVIDRLEQPTEN